MKKLFEHKEQIQLELNGMYIPVNVHYEFRKNVRVSLGKKAVNFRMPLGLSSSQKKEYWQWCKDYLLKNIQTVKDLYITKDYQNGDIIHTTLKDYLLKIEKTTNQSHSAKIIKKDDQLIIFLRINQEDKNYNKAIKSLISRVIASNQINYITERLHNINQEFFKVPVDAVKLKYTTSRWGSCSSKGNINLSTRLLLLPQEIMDYVIIHELAHRKEMNHSPRFWTWVAQAMPNYKEKERWLKKHGKEFDF